MKNSKNHEKYKNNENFQNSYSEYRIRYQPKVGLGDQLKSLQEMVRKNMFMFNISLYE